MTESPVSIDATTAQAIVEELRRTGALRSARVMLEAALSDAAEAAAWESFRGLLMVIDSADRDLAPGQRAHCDQFTAQLRELFADFGLSITDPRVLRSAMAAIYCAQVYALELVLSGQVPTVPSSAIASVVTTLQVSLARRVPAEFHP